MITTPKRRLTPSPPAELPCRIAPCTGSDVTFTSLGLSGTNVVPQGANSVHVLFYNASSFTANFEDVNRNGTPCGQSGTACKSPITVSAGSTLWLTWHVAYSWLGLPRPTDFLNYKSCPLPTLSGDATISVSALLSNGTFSLPCGPITANGYTLN